MLNATVANAILGLIARYFLPENNETASAWSTGDTSAVYLSTVFWILHWWQCCCGRLQRMRTNIRTILSTVMTSLQKCPLWPNLTVRSALRCVTQDRHFNSKFYKTPHYWRSRNVLANYAVQSASSFRKIEKNWKYLIFLTFYRNSQSYRSTEMYTFLKQWHFNSPRTFHRLLERKVNGRQQVVCQDGADSWWPAGWPSCLIFHVYSSIATEQRKECKGGISGFAEKKLYKKSLSVSKKRQEG
jgi:hypothetical protein